MTNGCRLCRTSIRTLRRWHMARIKANPYRYSLTHNHAARRRATRDPAWKH